MRLVYEESMAVITCPQLALADVCGRKIVLRGKSSKGAAEGWIKAGGRQANGSFVSGSAMAAKIASQTMSSRRVTELRMAKELLGATFEQHKVMKPEHFVDHINKGRPMTERGAEFMDGEFTVRIDTATACDVLPMPCSTPIRYDTCSTVRSSIPDTNWYWCICGWL